MSLADAIEARVEEVLAVMREATGDAWVEPDRVQTNIRAKRGRGLSVTMELSFPTGVRFIVVESFGGGPMVIRSGP